MKAILAIVIGLLVAENLEACGGRQRGGFLRRLFHRRHAAAACCQSETYYTYQTWSACGCGPTLLPPAPRSPYAGELPREKVEKIPEPPK